MYTTGMTFPTGKRLSQQQIAAAARKRILKSYADDPRWKPEKKIKSAKAIMKYLKDFAKGK